MLTLTHLGGFGGGGAMKVLIVALTASENNVSIAGKLSALGWNGAEPVDVTVNVAGTAQIGSGSTGAYALAIPALPAGSPPVKLNNAGRIQGAGGTGGAGGSRVWSTVAPTAGGWGGPALHVAAPTLLANSGVIAGGGGGGGGGEIWYDSRDPDSQGYVGGSGGGGGAGIAGGSGGAPGSASFGQGAYGSAGSADAGGAGAYSGGGPGAYGGGNGGGPGVWVQGHSFVTILSNTGAIVGGSAG